MSTETAPPPSLASAPNPVIEDKNPVVSEAVPTPQPTAPSTAAADSKLATTEGQAPSDAQAAEKPAAKDANPIVSTNPTEPSAPAGPEKTTIPPPSILSKFAAELPSIIREADHSEIWGIQLADEKHVPTSIVLEKFLRANTKDVAKAKAQLIEALKWRKKIEPQKLLDEVEFSKSKFGGLGYVTVYPKTENHEKEIVTWNIYGDVKDKKATFGDVEE